MAGVGAAERRGLGWRGKEAEAAGYCMRKAAAWRVGAIAWQRALGGVCREVGLAQVSGAPSQHRRPGGLTYAGQNEDRPWPAKPEQRAEAQGKTCWPPAAPPAPPPTRVRRQLPGPDARGLYLARSSTIRAGACHFIARLFFLPLPLNGRADQQTPAAPPLLRHEFRHQHFFR